MINIALLCEGTYPHMQGGVSVWCDQLIAGLPEHTFDVYAISGQRISLDGWKLPPNVRRLVSVPLWDQEPGNGRGWHNQDALDNAYAQLLYSLFIGTNDTGLFLAALRTIFEYAQLADLTPALTTRRNTVQLYQMWCTYGRSAAVMERQSDLLLQPTLDDALKASMWLEHFLRPLSCPPPEVDVCHAASNGLSPLLAFTCKWAYGTPFVLTEHGIYLRERYLEMRHNKHTPAFKSFLMRFYRLLTSAAYQMADLITPGSHYNERWEVRNGADPDRIRPVYNGVNPTFFPLRAEEPVAPTISWVGRIDPLKDLGTLIRAFGVVREAMPDARLRMFGAVPRGNEGYAQHCQAMIDQFGLKGAATFEGRIEDVVNAYHAGHMVALTSISEGFPYTLIEAMASGKATVATDVGGVTEALGSTGLIVPSRDHEAVAQASLTLLGNSGLRKTLGQAARTRVLSQFTLESFLHVYRHIYPHVVLQGSSGRWVR